MWPCTYILFTYHIDFLALIYSRYQQLATYLDFFIWKNIKLPLSDILLDISNIVYAISAYLCNFSGPLRICILKAKRPQWYLRVTLLDKRVQLLDSPESAQNRLDSPAGEGRSFMLWCTCNEQKIYQNQFGCAD